MVFLGDPPTNTRKDKIKSNLKTNPSCRMLQLWIAWRRRCMWASLASDGLLLISPRGLLIFDEEMMTAFDSPWLSLGFLKGIRLRMKCNRFLFFQTLLLPFLVFPMELLHLLNFPWSFLTVVTWKLAVEDFCNLKWGWKTSRYLPVCDARVGSDVFKSARIMLRVGSSWLESARLSVHT